MATEKEKRAERENRLLNKLNELEGLIVSQSSKNNGQCKAEDLLFFIGELKEIFKAQAEVNRIAYDIAYYYFKDNYSWYFKALRSNLYKI